MPNDVEALMEMGFSQNRAQKALAKTNYSGVGAATEWLFAHEGDADIDDEFIPPQGNTLSAPSAETSMETSTGPTEGQPAAATVSDTSMQPKSLKCDECGKLLKSSNEVELHATRTGHASFSESTEEIKPLTEEEKQAQLAKVQELMKQKRLEREEKEKQEQLEREKARRVHGKEMTNIKQKMQDDEMKKIMEDRRREKEEEKKARQRVREQIEKDKLDRATKFAPTPTAGAPGPSSGVSPSAASSVISPASPPAAAAAAAAQPKEYKETNIQIRLFSGETVTNKFAVSETLAAVRLFVHSKLTDGQLSGDFASLTFATTFPRRVFSEDDMQTPLSMLGLVPSAALMLTKAAQR